MSCSRSNAAIAPKVLKQIKSKLQVINEIFPGAKSPVIIRLDPMPDLLLCEDATFRIDCVPHVIDLAADARKFCGATVNDDVVEAVHIYGSSSVFSIIRFMENTHVLAFFTSISGDFNSNTFDCASANTRLRELCDDLQHLLYGIHIPVQRDRKSQQGHPEQ